MARVTYKAPVMNKRGKITYEEKSGTVKIVQVGNEKIRCAIQDKSGADEFGPLVHIPSGYVIISAKRFGADHLRRFVASGVAWTHTDSVNQTIAEFMAEHGAAFVEKLKKVEIINPDV